MGPKGVRAAALGFPTGRRPISQSRRNPEPDSRQRAGVHRSRHKPTKKQRRVATEFARFERSGLHDLEHLGGGSMLKASPVDRSPEKEPDQGMEQYPSRRH